MKREENYTLFMAIGLVLTLATIAAFAVYSLGENTRLAKAADAFSQERVSLGRNISMKDSPTTITGIVYPGG